MFKTVTGGLFDVLFWVLSEHGFAWDIIANMQIPDAPKLSYKRIL
jgi:hypothetical protein